MTPDPSRIPADPSQNSPSRIMREADRIVATGESAPRRGRDPVNQPMINNWVEAIGDQNPAYVDESAAVASAHGGVVAPPAMAQVWTMGGLSLVRNPADPLYAAMTMLDEAGFTSVLATNCEQSYSRYLRLGEEVSVTTRLESVVGPKKTTLGEGYFVTTRSTWYVAAEAVATMMFRVLKFRPQDVVAEPGVRSARRPAGAAVVGPGGRASEARPDGRQVGGRPGAADAGPGPDVLRPMVNRDTEFFWDGTRIGELRIQQCGSCGQLRHPPGPMCPHCRATEPTYVVASGSGTIYSYVVHRHPSVPGRELPIVLALVELEEGVRMVGELLDAAPEDVQIGAAVTVSMAPIDDELTVPAWRRAGGADA